KSVPGHKPPITRKVGDFRSGLVSRRLWADALPRRAPRRQVGSMIGRRRDVHQDGLGGGCDLDAVLLEALLHAAVELALDRPAAGFGAADLADDRDHRAVDLVDAPEFEIAADQRAEVRLATHLVDDVLED